MWNIFNSSTIKKGLTDKQVLESIENGKTKAAAAESINTNGSSKKGKSGIRKKYETPTMNVEDMTPEKLDEMIKTLNGDDKEIGDI